MPSRNWNLRNNRRQLRSDDAVMNPVHDLRQRSRHIDNEQENAGHDLGKMNLICPLCGAFRWRQENTALARALTRRPPTSKCSNHTTL